MKRKRLRINSILRFGNHNYTHDTPASHWQLLRSVPPNTVCNWTDSSDTTFLQAGVLHYHSLNEYASRLFTPIHPVIGSQSCQSNFNFRVSTRCKIDHSTLQSWKWAATEINLEKQRQEKSELLNLGTLFCFHSALLRIPVVNLGLIQMPLASQSASPRVTQPG